MTLIDRSGIIHDDSLEEITESLRATIERGCPRMETFNNCLYRFTPDGELDVYDVSRKPFVHLRLSIVERQTFKEREEVYTKDFHVQAVSAKIARAYGDNGLVGEFPMELLLRW